MSMWITGLAGAPVSLGTQPKNFAGLANDAGDAMMAARSPDSSGVAGLPVSMPDRTISLPHATLVFGVSGHPARDRAATGTTSPNGQLKAGIDTATRERPPRQPLFPCRYETWRSKRNGREVVVVGYDEDLGEVEYMYLDDRDWVHATRSDTWTKRFVFMRSP